MTSALFFSLHEINIVAMTWLIIRIAVYYMEVKFQRCGYTQFESGYIKFIWISLKKNIKWVQLKYCFSFSLNFLI